ncbi:MAG TPA: hypothetical protein PLX23_00300 [Candidatus Hydrogenedens sp.]|nr:hypothetical protein [Candidatus Hydrogenedens sp.]
MEFPYKITNTSFLLPDCHEKAYEVWYWKLNPQDEAWSFWFRYTLLKNEAKSVIEVWGIFTRRETQKKEEGENVQNIAIKETFPIEQCKYGASENANSISIGENFVDFITCKGNLCKRDNQLSWGLNLTPIFPQSSFNFIPRSLWRLGIVKNYTVTVHEKMLFNGNIKVNEDIISVQNALGMQGHLAGLKQGHSWAWAHSCIFSDEETGESVPIIIDVLSACARIGKKMVSPQLTTLFLYYDGKEYILNSIKSILSTKSRYIPLFWEIKGKTCDFIFSISIEADMPTVVGVQYEDTDGSMLYCYNTKMATIKLILHDLTNNNEKHFVSLQKGAFEWVQRKPWDKVSLYIQ